jgi:hypothetical protein
MIMFGLLSQTKLACLIRQDLVDQTANEVAIVPALPRVSRRHHHEHLLVRVDPEFRAQLAKYYPISK